MEQKEREYDLPCRGANDEACSEMVHYKREAISGMWRSITVYLSCKKGHINSYEIPRSTIGSRAPRGRPKKNTSIQPKPRRSPKRRARRHER